MEINKEKLGKILREQREEYQRHLDVIAEDFKSQTKLIAESISAQQEQLSALREIAAKNAESIVDLQTQIIAIREMVAKNTEDIEMMKAGIMAMKKDIEIIKTDVSSIKYELKRKVNRDEFEALEKRVLFLEKKFKG